MICKEQTQVKEQIEVWDDNSLRREADQLPYSENGCKKGASTELVVHGSVIG
jgi:hypothetical protein